MVEGHAFAGAYLPIRGEPVLVETTGCGNGTVQGSKSCDWARESAERTYKKALADGRYCMTDVSFFRTRGVTPPELPQLGATQLDEWKIVLPTYGQMAVAPPPEARTAPAYCRWLPCRGFVGSYVTSWLFRVCVISG